MERNSLPPGFRFHPTDVELIKYYLRRKVMGKPLRLEVIAEIELYKFAPWDLPEKSCLKSKDLEWYFFCPRDRKYTIGPRKNRATEIGYWKTTGKDRSIRHNSRTVGMKKTLVFHLGKSPQGIRTDWVMHEYRLEDRDLVDKGISQDTYVLSKFFEKSGRGPKNGEQHGAPFREEEWDSDDVINDSLISIFLGNPSSPPQPADCQNLATIERSIDFNNEYDSLMGPFPEHKEAPVAYEDDLLLEYFDAGKLLQELYDDEDGALVSNENGADEELHDDEGGSFVSNENGVDEELYDDEDSALVSIENGVNEKPYLIIPQSNGNIRDGVPVDGDEMFIGLEDIGSQAELHKLYFPINLEYEMPLDVIEGSFLEFSDLQDSTDPSVVDPPMDHVIDGSCLEFSDLQDSTEPSVVYSPLNVIYGSFLEFSARQDSTEPSVVFEISDNLWADYDDTLDFPVSEVDNYGCSLEFEEIMSDPTAPVQNEEEIENNCVPQALAGGEQNLLSPSLGHISDGGGSYSMLHYLLDSVPASPASASEYSPIEREDHKSSLSLYGSSIHFKAEVTVRSVSTGDHVSGQLGVPPRIDFGGGKPSKKLGRQSSLRCGGFMFVFVLGLISVLMWAFLLAMGAKLGRYTWKNFLCSLN